MIYKCSFLLMTINYLKAVSQGRCPRPQLGSRSRLLFMPPDKVYLPGDSPGFISTLPVNTQHPTPMLGSLFVGRAEHTFLD